MCHCSKAWLYYYPLPWRLIFLLLLCLTPFTWSPLKPFIFFYRFFHANCLNSSRHQIKLWEKSSSDGKKFLIIVYKSFYPFFSPCTLLNPSFYSFHLYLSAVPSSDLLSRPQKLLTAWNCSVLLFPPLSSQRFFFNTSSELQHVSGGSCSDFISQINDYE